MTGLGKQKIILGFPWLNKHNPIIDWKKGKIKWQPLKIDCRGLLEKGQRIRMEQQLKVEEIADKEETKNYTKNPIEEDKNAILIKLLEESTKQMLQQNWLSRKTTRKRKKPTKN